MTGVVLVGHYHDHLNQLISLYEENKPTLPHEVIVVCNHPEPYNTDYPYLHTKNDGMRDIGMYRAALQHTGWEWAFFLNDDVVVMRGDWFGEAVDLLHRGVDIVGAQPNPVCALTRIGRRKMWTDTKGEASVPPEYESDEAFQQACKLRFIRTHAFAATTTYFEKVWDTAHKNEPQTTAMSFERHTIKAGGVYHFLSHYNMLLDRNIVDYEEYLSPNQRFGVFE